MNSMEKSMQLDELFALRKADKEREAKRRAETDDSQSGHPNRETSEGKCSPERAEETGQKESVRV